MLLRILSFLLSQFAGGLLGAWQAGLWGSLIGMSLALWLWLAWDVWRSARLLAWLRQPEMGDAPPLSGVWGEISARMRRVWRAERQQTTASEARLSEFLAALQASPNGVLLLDREGHIEWCNQTAAAHFALDVQRDLMQSIGNLLREPEFSHYYASADYEHELLLPGRDHSPSHPVMLSVRLHPYGEGRLLMLSREVTALQQAEAMRRDFIANVSHELRTPLTVLMGFVETMQTLALTESERHDYLALMAQQSQRMRNLVQDLLTLSQLEASPAPRFDQWQSVEQIVHQCAEEARALSALLYPEQKQQLQFPTAAQLAHAGEIAGHPHELHSALSNLLNNAVRYTPAMGHITCTWEPLPDGSARFSVRDSGAGIAPEHLARLTERFYRVDRARSRESGGTGLGLAIAKHALQRHGASLQVHSTLGQGSEFVVTFPAQRLRFEWSISGEIRPA